MKKLNKVKLSKILGKKIKKSTKLNDGKLKKKDSVRESVRRLRSITRMKLEKPLLDKTDPVIEPTWTPPSVRRNEERKKNGSETTQQIDIQIPLTQTLNESVNFDKSMEDSNSEMSFGDDDKVEKKLDDGKLTISSKDKDTKIEKK